MKRATRGEAFLLALADAILVALAFAAAYLLRFWYELGAVVDVPPPPLGNYGEALVITWAVFGWVLRARGLYGPLAPSGFDTLERCLGAVTQASIIVLAVSFFYRDFSYSRTVCLIAWGLSCVAVPVPRIVLLLHRRARYRKGLDLVPALIVGAGRRALRLAARLQDTKRFGLAIRGLVVAGPPAEPPEGLPILGKLDQLEALIRASGVREVLISDTLHRLELLEVLETCERLGVETRVVPHIYDLFIRPGDLSELYGVPFVAVRERRDELLSLALKRVFDLVVGGALLLVSLPLVAALALLIKRESSGPAFFSQTRIGRSGRPFALWKLRSMVPDAEARLGELVAPETLARDPVFKLPNDPRVTRVGRVLRRWSLDELPQLWNVVKGEMSLVGPRPEVEALVRHYDAHHRRRLKAKPGLTGLQQLEARASPDIDERIRHDVYYIRRRTFLFDLWILARTPWAVLHGRGAT